MTFKQFKSVYSCATKQQLLEAWYSSTIQLEEYRALNKSSHEIIKKLILHLKDTNNDG